MSFLKPTYLQVALAMYASFFSLVAFGAPEFIENKGQWEGSVLFRSELNGGLVWGEETGLTFLLLSQAYSDFGHDGATYAPEEYKAHAYKMNFEGANLATAEGENPSSHHYNYFLGNDPLRWAQEVTPFGKMRLPQLYQGIEMVLYSTHGNLKYDLNVAPYADVSQVVFSYDGLEGMRIQNGKLLLQTSIRTVKEMAPFAYQMVGSKMVEVKCKYVLEGNRVHFELGEYDLSLPLVIDPEITFASYIGSIASNFGFTATDDLDGNLVAGSCIFQAGYPTTLGAIQDDFEFFTNGYCDVGVSKFSADGSQLMYSTYIGGSGVEMPHSIICDDDGNYIVMGTTGSPNFPTTVGAFQPALIGGPEFSFSTFFINAAHQDGCDFFIAKFNGGDSGLIASTYVGGSGTDGLNMGDKLFYNYGDSFRGEVIVSPSGEIVVASTTLSTDFPMGSATYQNVNSGGHDAIVFRMSSNLTTLNWASYLGSPSDDAAYSVQFDSATNMVVTGGTKEAGIVTSPNAQNGSFQGDVDAFIVRFNGNGTALEASTYLGTPEYDQAYFVQLDAADNIYVIGQTEGDFEIQGDVYANPGSGQFIAKFDNDLANLDWLTTIGTGSGEIDISPTAFLVSDCDQIYFSGWGGQTNSNNAPYALNSTTEGLPITDDAFQSVTDGSDFYLCVLAPDATELVYATWFGGGSSREHVDGGTSKFDKDGSVYQAVCAGCGGNDDFPTTAGAWSNDNGSTNCNLGVFKFDLGKIEAEIAIDGPSQVCEGSDAIFVNNTIGGTSFEWTFGDGGESNSSDPLHIFEVPGLYEVMMIASDFGDCVEPDTAYITIEVLPGVNPSFDEVPLICDGDLVQLWGYGSDNLFWLDDPTLSATDIDNPIATPSEPTTYFLVDFNDCEAETLEVVVNFVLPQTTISEDQTICIGNSVDLEVTGGVDYIWSPATGLSDPFAPNPTATPMETIEYTVAIITIEGCETEETITIQVDFDIPGGEVYDPVAMCVGTTVQLEAVNGIAWSWSPEEYCNNPNLQFPTVNPPETTTFFVEVTNACGTGTDQVTVELIIPSAVAGSDGAVCLGAWHPVFASGGETYQWQPSQFVLDPESPTTLVSPPTNQTFTVYVTDEFGCTVSEEVNVTVLPLPYVDAGPDRVINWMEYDYIFGTVDGTAFWWEPDIDISCTDCITPIVDPEDPLWYTLHTIDSNGCIGVDSVFVDVFYPLYVPNTFTPNNDGINDVFRAYGDNVREFRMEIRNRWGELIFASNSIEDVWDGSVHGGEHYVQIDTYVWTIWFDTKEGMEKLVGHVNVIR
jgi:gliding motility-associated-like protein